MEYFIDLSIDNAPRSPWYLWNRFFHKREKQLHRSNPVIFFLIVTKKKKRYMLVCCLLYLYHLLEKLCFDTVLNKSSLVIFCENITLFNKYVVVILIDLPMESQSLAIGIDRYSCPITCAYGRKLRDKTKQNKTKVYWSYLKP